MKVTNGWKRIPRRARIGATVAVPVLALALAGVLVAHLTGAWPLGGGAKNAAAAGQERDRDTPGTGEAPAEQHPDTPPVGRPSASPTPRLSPSAAPPPASPRPAAPEPAVDRPSASPSPAPDGSAVYLEARLTGRAEVPSPGGPGGPGKSGSAGRPAVGDKDGHARAWVRISGNQLCFSVAWRKLSRVTGAHVHAGTEGVNGPVRVGFFGELPESLQTAVGCVLVDDSATLGRIVTNPAGYYVNLHSVEAPGGAVRGQLRRLDRPVDLLEPVRGPLVALARGEAEVPAVGDLDGAGTGFVRARAHEIRYGFTWVGIGAPTSAHLHAGPVGVAGDVAVELFTAPAGLPPTLFAVAGAVADPRLAVQLNQNPAAYYVNVHTSQFPKGAVRGQLFRAS